MLDSQPGTLMLTDCIDTCRANASCRSITYETGLCVLFSSNADGNDGKRASEPMFGRQPQKCSSSAPNSAFCLMPVPVGNFLSAK